MKVLFLDVDGVLAHSESIPLARTSGEPPGSSFFYAAMVDVSCVLRLKHVLDATETKVVLSSVWRQSDAQTTGLRRAFLNAGYERRALRDLLLGPTPMLEDRTTEVADWLSRHTEVNRYVVLDDDVVGNHPQLSVRPNFYTGGLLDEHVEPLIRLLSDPV